jgi:hypothetical protein
MRHTIIATKYLLMVATLMLVSNAARAADWAATAEAGDFVHYIDTANIKSDGDIRQAWLLTEWKSRSVSGVLSQRSLMEFDCKNARVRTLPDSESYHSGPMGTGNVIKSSLTPNYEWADIAPFTPGSVTLKVVCSR